MEKAIETLQESAKELDKMAAGTNMALTEMRVQFETLASMQQQERLEIQRMHHEEISKIIERNDKQLSHFKHIVIGLIVTICLIIGSIVGAAIYVVSNFDFEFQDGYELNQNIDIGGNGDPQIQDGIHFNTDD